MVIGIIVYLLAGGLFVLDRYHHAYSYYNNTFGDYLLLALFGLIWPLGYIFIILDRFNIVRW